ncbi:MAG: LysR family transcriptional regulator [Pseudomonadota bacterium]|nr:LysR family transcriptional regulator [Pseudomonadota bacterium]
MKGVDLGLLQCLIMLVEEQHVSRAATRASQSQSAMSYSLSRLRDILNDPILVRTAHGMEATERARAVAAQLGPSIASIQDVLRAGPAFEPASSSQKFRISASGYLNAVLMPAVMQRFSQTSPNSEIEIVASLPIETREKLENGEIDLSIGFWISLSETLLTRKLFDEDVVLIARTGHPELGEICTPQQLGQLDFAVYTVADRTMANYETLIDGMLAEQGVKRTIRFRCPNIHAIPPVIAASDLVAVLPKRAAETFRNQLGIRIIPCSVPLPGFTLSATWHARNRDSAPHAWLRSEVAKTARSLIEN